MCPKFESQNVQLKNIEDRLSKAEKNDEQHSKHCPLNMDTRVKALEKDLKVVRFFSTNYLIFAAVIILVLIALNKQELIQLIK